MNYELIDIEIEILQKLNFAKYNRLKGIKYKIQSSEFNLTGEVEADHELGFHIESLREQGYIFFNREYAVSKSDSVNYKGSNITNIYWDYILITQKGTLFIENYEREKIREQKSIHASMIYEMRKVKYAEAIKVISENDTYVEISINANGTVIDGILIDKEHLPLIQEYSWSINRDNMIITRKHYEISKKNNISINQLLFEEELKKLKSLTGKEHVAYFKNGNNLDKRRSNLIFMTRSEQLAMKNLDKITGIYLSSNNNTNRTSYEVRINKSKEKVYLIKTTDYREAFYGAFLLRFLFWGRKYCKPFTEKLFIDGVALDNLEIALEKYKVDFIETEFVQVLIRFNLSNEFIARVLKIMDKKRHLLV